MERLLRGPGLPISRRGGTSSRKPFTGAHAESSYVAARPRDAASCSLARSCGRTGIRAEEYRVSGGVKCDKPRDAKLSGNVSVQEAPFDMVWQLSANDKAHVSLKKITFFTSTTSPTTWPTRREHQWSLDPWPGHATCSCKGRADAAARSRTL